MGLILFKGKWSEPNLQVRRGEWESVTQGWTLRPGITATADIWWEKKVLPPKKALQQKSWKIWCRSAAPVWWMTHLDIYVNFCFTPPVSNWSSLLFAQNGALRKASWDIQVYTQNWVLFSLPVVVTFSMDHWGRCHATFPMEILVLSSSQYGWGERTQGRQETNHATWSFFKKCGLIIGWLIDVGRRLFLEHLQKSENPDLPTHRSGSDWIDWIGFFIPFWKDTPEEQILRAKWEPTSCELLGLSGSVFFFLRP